MKNFIILVFKNIFRDEKFTDTLIMLLPFCMVMFVMGWIATGMTTSSARIDTLERSHAYLEQRQDDLEFIVLKDIACGFCHDNIPDGMGRHGHAGGEANIRG